MRTYVPHLLLSLALSSGISNLALGQDLAIDSIIRARITADGDVAGRATDFLINLDVPRDHNDGLTLPAGHRFEVIVPPEFVNDREVVDFNTKISALVDTETVFTSNSCTIGNFFCNTGVFVQGWPQRPMVTVLPPALNQTFPDDHQVNTELYTLGLGDNQNHFVFTAQASVGPGSPPPGPGIKQIHMILPGFRNPEVTEPTDYPIIVRETKVEGDNTVVLQEATGTFTVIPEIQPSINLTSIYDPARNNTVYQEVKPGEMPHPYEFFLWDGNGGAYTGVTISGNDVLNEAQERIGQVTITGPEGATGQSLASLGASSNIDGGDIFFHLPTARLSAQFTPGDLPGEYVTTIDFFNKEDLGAANPAVYSTEVLTVNVVPEPATWGLLSISLLGCLQWRRRRG